MANDDKNGYPLLLVLLAVIVVAGVSFLPLTRLTDGFLKDFDLLEDISDRVIDRGEADELIDPLLMEAMLSADSVLVAESEPAVKAEEVDTVTGTPLEAPRRDGVVLMEDFSTDGRSGLSRLKGALAQAGSRQVRIGVIGDSYIEGDIFTQDVRELLQERYGGHGVGYVPMTSEVSGFRRSVRQSDEGWTEHDLRTDKSVDCRWLSGQRFTSSPGAVVTWKASQRPQHATSWNKATIVLKAPSAGDISLRINGGERQDFHVEGGDSIQTVCVTGDMTSLSMTNRSVAALTVYGAWLTDSTGVVLDGMSLRGNSGIVHSALSPRLASEMRTAVDYDLIVLEYGLNAVSSKQKNYSYYGDRMKRVIERLRECYPSADIVLMGAGDRGQKSGSNVSSMPTVQSMVNTQRSVAREAGVVFWDTRAAMGGEDAIVRWHEAKEVNADYIHLNFDGGRHLAELFVEALTDNLAE